MKGKNQKVVSSTFFLPSSKSLETWSSVYLHPNIEVQVGKCYSYCPVPQKVRNTENKVRLHYQPTIIY